MYKALNQRSNIGFLPQALLLAMGQLKIVVIRKADSAGPCRTQQNFQTLFCLSSSLYNPVLYVISCFAS